MALLRLMLSVWALWRLTARLLPTRRARWLLLPAGGGLAGMVAVCTAAQMEGVCLGLLGATLAASLFARKRRKEG